MPTKVNVKGNRNLRKSSRKGSRSGSRKSSKKEMDFTSVLDDKMPMGDDQMVHQQMMQQMMPPGMNMNMMGNMMGMPPMMGMPMGPSMGMPIGTPMQNIMMLGKDTEKNIDPLHVQYMVPQNQNLNINNYGISSEQLTKGADQLTGLSQQFNNMHMGSQEQGQTVPQMQAPMQVPMQNQMTMNTQVQQIQKQ